MGRLPAECGVQPTVVPTSGMATKGSELNQISADHWPQKTRKSTSSLNKVFIKPAQPKRPARRRSNHGGCRMAIIGPHELGWKT
jgi:hypothetical protein